MDRQKIKLLFITQDQREAQFFWHLLSPSEQAKFRPYIFHSFEDILSGCDQPEYDLALVCCYNYDEKFQRKLWQLSRQLDVPIILITAKTQACSEIFIQDCLNRHTLNAEILERSINYSLTQWRTQKALRESNKKLSSLRQELKENQRQIIQQERIRALGEMASGIVHDFYNALVSIVGFSELMILRPNLLKDEEKAKSYLDYIYTAANDSAEIIKKLGNFYKKDDKLHENFQPVEISELLQKVISMTEPKWHQQALEQGVEIEIKTNLSETPAVLGNASELREAFINLIFNAVDAIAEKGEIFIESRANEYEVIIEIQDTGRGMSEHVKNQCLAPFFSTKGQQGSGLGLAMVASIIQRHNGKLEILSQENEGTTFVIKLPVVFQERNQQIKRMHLRCQPISILVVERDFRARNFLCEYLREEGHEVQVASDGQEGLHAFMRRSFDLVITASLVPKKNGYELAKQIKALCGTQPIAMLVDFSQTNRVNQPSSSGVDYFIKKPIVISALQKVVSLVAKQCGKKVFREPVDV